jgi:hypothetical protein
VTNGSAHRPILAILVTVVWGLLTVPGLVIALFGAPMAFDAPGSAANPLVWAIVFGVISFPVLCIVSIAGSWIAWKMSGPSASSRAASGVRFVMACLPLIPVIVVVTSMALSAAVTTGGNAMEMHEQTNPLVPAPHAPQAQPSLIRPIPTVPPESHP